MRIDTGSKPVAGTCIYTNISTDTTTTTSSASAIVSESYYYIPPTVIIDIAIIRAPRIELGTYCL